MLFKTVSKNYENKCGRQKGQLNMNTLTKEYTLLFNTITDAEEALRQLSLTLMEAQRQAEELFLEAEQEAPAEKGA